MTHDWGIHECVHFECGCLEHASCVFDTWVAGLGGVWADRASKVGLVFSMGLCLYWSAVFLVHYSCELPSL